MIFFIYVGGVYYMCLVCGGEVIGMGEVPIGSGCVFFL